jgi:hypothetical protein
MRYWDEDRPEWSEPEHDFAAAWRKQPKWVVSRSLKSVGPNATLVADDIEAEIRRLKARLGGEIEVAGPDLARSLADLGLVDEYRLYGDAIAARALPMAASLRADGLTLRQIAARLNQSGVATARGGRWQPQQVANLLRRA